MVRPRTVLAVAAIFLGLAAGMLAVMRLSHDRTQTLLLLGAAVVFMVLGTVAGGAGKSRSGGRTP